MKNNWVRLNYIFLLAIMLVISMTLTAAMVLQFVYHEIPCPLCLLQRLAFFGIAFGMISAFRQGYSPQHLGFAMLFLLYLVIVGARQSLLNIVPRAGHVWIGGPVFGMHLPVWSVVTGLCLFGVFALALAVIPQGKYLNKRISATNFPLIARSGNLFALYLVALCALNLVAVILQCGFGMCHTFSYSLLEQFST